jgi:hypothetical protein
MSGSNEFAIFFDDQTAASTSAQALLTIYDSQSLSFSDHLHISLKMSCCSAAATTLGIQSAGAAGLDLDGHRHARREVEPILSSICIWVSSSETRAEQSSFCLQPLSGLLARINGIRVVAFCRPVSNDIDIRLSVSLETRRRSVTAASRTCGGC